MSRLVVTGVAAPADVGPAGGAATYDFEIVTTGDVPSPVAFASTNAPFVVSIGLAADGAP